MTEFKNNTVDCPACGHPVTTYRNPTPTVDVIIEVAGQVVLVERANEPLGWALPGGFVDYGETLEDAAVREAFEETGLKVRDLRLFGVYSDPQRDPRQHNISVVFTASASGELCAGDDAAKVRLFPLEALPYPLCFDHAQILRDFRTRRVGASPDRVVPLL